LQVSSDEIKATIVSTAISPGHSSIEMISNKSDEMRELTAEELTQVSGGLAWEGYRQSDNIQDLRGCTPMDTYINPGSGTAASCDNPRFRN
jgi:hypothetical protein